MYSTSVRDWTVTSLVIVALMLATTSPAWAQQTPVVSVGRPIQASLPQLRAVNLPDMLPAEGAWHANHEMRLRSDGNLPGQLRSFDATGNMTPVRGRLFFVQNNQIVGRANTDEQGNFQITKLDPGTYSVVATSLDGFGAFSVRINSPSQQQSPQPRVKSIAEGKGDKGKDDVSAKAADDVDLADIDERVFDGLTMQVTMASQKDITTIGRLIGEHIPEMRAYMRQAVASPDYGRAFQTAPAVQQPPAPASGVSNQPRPNRLTSLLMAKAMPALPNIKALPRGLPDAGLPQDGPWFTDHTMRTMPDGHVRGQLRTFSDDGRLIAVKARMYFIHAGIVEMAGQSDAHGRFDLSGMEPGTYSVLAASHDGLGTFAIRVLPSDVANEPAVNPPVEPNKPKEADDRNPAQVPAKQAAFHRSVVQGGSMYVSLASSGNFQQIALIAQQNVPSMANSMGGGVGGGLGGLAGAGAGAGVGAGAAIGGAGGSSLLGSVGGIAAGAGLFGAAASAGQNSSSTGTTSSSTSAATTSN